MTASPREEDCLVDEAFSVFVSVDGDAGGDGSRDAPLASVSAGAAMAQAEGRGHVLVCEGAYAETLSLVGLTASLRVTGGLLCANWRPKDTRSRIAPEAGSALNVDDAQASVVLESLSFEAPGAVSPGGSAIAARVVDSQDVTLVDVELTAGDGAAGLAGVVGAYDFPLTSGCTGGEDEDNCIEGKSATGVDNGGPRVFTCPGVSGQTAGGRGGAGGPAPEDGADGLPVYGDMGGEGGSGDAGGCASGRLGAAGPAGDPGAPAQALGALTADGSWMPAPGEPGADGHVGQGGGGGGAVENGGGGGGGGGGCGGIGGSAGAGGGASIALLSVGSSVTLQACTLGAGNGGAGGAGAAGQPGQVSGGAFGEADGDACRGGNGGPGGDGGPGGGGAGGLSVAVLYSGPEPARSQSTTLEVGDAGDGGGAGPQRGVAGVAQSVLSL